MIDQYFGHKELSSVVLRAKNPMWFGERYIEAEEPLLYFDNIQMASVTEPNHPVFARGGWANLPRVIWDDRKEVQFSMSQGVMSSVGMSILLSSQVLSEKEKESLYINMKEGPLPIVSMYKADNDLEYPCIELRHKPVRYPEKKFFIFDYEYNTIQQKLYGKLLEINDPYGKPHWRLALSKDKNFSEPAENTGKYVVDYYYKYEDEEENGALIYTIEPQRFNGFFILEAQFESKDENDGRIYSNILFMPKVKIVSEINLRLGERANPMVSNFAIIGLPDTVGEQKNLIMEITRLGEPIDGDI